MAATVSGDGTYRYRLEREWDPDLPTVVWIMLNPSTADADSDDNTIRKCIGFSQLWRMGGLVVVNLYAARATDPKQLGNFDDPVGFFNDGHIARAVRENEGPIVAAWGSAGRSAPGFWGRINKVINLPELEVRQLDCLGVNRDRTPTHPLMLSWSSTRLPWRLPNA